ncbi:MAG: sodium:solute symporter family transporter, partial [Parachlamydiaceae bacterium]
MNIPLFIALLFSLQILYWLVGRRSSKEVSEVKDYFLAGKQVAFFPLMMTFLATQVGGGVILGSSDEAYKYGWQVIFYPLGAALGLMLLGSGIGKKLAELPVATVAEIFEWSYGSKTLKKAASLLSVISLFMILVAQIVASSKFLISMGFENRALFILFWAIVILYTTQGGLKAVISTDLVQAAFFSIIFVFATGYVMLDTKVVSIPLNEMPDIGDKLYGWLLMPLLFMFIE